MIPQGISFLAIHHPGVENVLVDFLSSKMADSREWTLHRTIVNRIFEIWGTPQIDLFMTSQNTRLPQFCSLLMDAL